MRRWIAASAVMLVVPMMATGLGSTANAQGAPADPIDALKRQLVENRGVKMSKVHTSTYIADGEKEHFWTEAVAEFGRGKITTIDMTYDSDRRNWTDPIRQITIEGRQYIQDDHLPNGKSWIPREDNEIRPVLSADWIKLADPVMLKAVLATTKVKRPAGIYDGTPTALYQGTINLGQLYKASPGFPFGLVAKPTRKEAKAKISWRLWLGEDQLVRRAWGSWREPFSKNGDVPVSYVVDARLTGWGAETDIAVPSADDVVTPSDWSSSETSVSLNPAAG
ncbi:hypothetical protein AB0F88_24560 [Streptosporangium sp. NPDC023963]|uniref:hypothetical protein n=1 Tax=Streptosporangium sp. NPDC023963 TaxID=3155608 RepID=UPI0034128A87